MEEESTVTAAERKGKDKERYMSNNKYQYMNTARNNARAVGAASPLGSLFTGLYFAIDNFTPSAPKFQQHSDSVIHNFSPKSSNDNADIASTEKALNLLKNGYVRQNRYLVEITPPKVLAGFSGDKAFNTGKVGLLCNSVSLPAKMMQVYEHKNLGAPYRVPHSLSFDPIPMSFYCDKEMEVRRFFDSWQKGIIDERTGLVNFYDEFVTTMLIHMLDVTGQIIYTVKLSEAYPMMLSNVDMSYSSNNTPTIMTTTIAYKYWNEVYKK